MVENVTFPPEIYALNSICNQFLVKYTTFCVLLPFFCYDMIFEFFAKVADFEEKIFRVKNIPVSNFFKCQYIGIKLPA